MDEIIGYDKWMYFEPYPLFMNIRLANQDKELILKPIIRISSV